MRSKEEFNKYLRTFAKVKNLDEEKYLTQFEDHAYEYGYDIIREDLFGLNRDEISDLFYSNAGETVRLCIYENLILFNSNTKYLLDYLVDYPEQEFINDNFEFETIEYVWEAIRILGVLPKSKLTDQKLIYGLILTWLEANRHGRISLLLSKLRKENTGEYDELIKLLGADEIFKKWSRKRISIELFIKREIERIKSN